MRASFIISILILFFYSNVLAQHMIVSSSDEYAVQYMKHNGEMILNNGESIMGIFQYAYNGFPGPDIKYFSSSGQLLKRYKLSDIKSVTLFGTDTTLSNKDSTYFIRIGKSTLYRQLTFGKIKLFDPLIIVNEKNGLIKSEGTFRETVFALENNVMKNFKSKREILKYVQNKLKEENITLSFKSIKEAIRYLNFSIRVTHKEYTIDTSGIYLTKTDFLSNTLQYKTVSNISTPTFPLFARFVVSCDAFPIHLKIDKENIKKFSPGSFFAFNNDGVKYLYLKESKDYVAVVNDAPPLFMIVRKNVHFSGSTAFADDIYLYTRNLNDPFKEFTKENITADFGNNKKEMDILLELRQKIIKEGYDAEIHKRAFLKCRKLVGTYMEKLKNVLI